MYDPISYHQGSVWPLFTGWAAMAQYRSGHPLAGYQATMQNADLTTAQDLGAVTELLSGAFFEPFGRSTSHQLWSSAMVVTPILRGLFGLQIDALHHAISVSPNLPADWPSAEIHQLHVGESIANVTFRRNGDTLDVSVKTLAGPPVHLTGSAGEPTSVRLPLPAVEVSIPHALPLPGARTAQMKVLDETRTAHSLHLELEGPGGSEMKLAVQRNDPSVTPHAAGATLTGNSLLVRFPQGAGYQTQELTLSW
jgi:hypothetical protein